MNVESTRASAIRLHSLSCTPRAPYAIAPPRTALNAPPHGPTVRGATYLRRHTPATRMVRTHEPCTTCHTQISFRIGHTAHVKRCSHPQGRSLGRSSEWPCRSPWHACTLRPSPSRNSSSCRLPLFRRACGGQSCIAGAGPGGAGGVPPLDARGTGWRRGGGMLRGS